MTQRQSNKVFAFSLAGSILLLCYIICSFCSIRWIYEHGFHYLRWHIILWIYLSIALGFVVAGYLLFHFQLLNTESAKRICLILSGLLFSFYLAEAFLRITGNGTTYTEKREGIFINPSERLQKKWYMVGYPHQSYVLNAPEYSYPRKNNSLGLADTEWKLLNDSNEVRIITLGDSFTEGDGAQFDSSYPRLLETLLQQDFPALKINVMNAGKCGSDPWFEYKKFHDLLLAYSPDIVIYTNGPNDLLGDHLYYGGMERFQPDSTVKNKMPVHRWMTIYELSYLFRLITTSAGYDDTFFGIHDREQNRETALADSRELSKMFSELAMKNNFICIQFVRPEKQDIEDGYYDFDYSKLIVQPDSLPNYFTFNLLEYYLDSLQMNKDASDYFWKIDGHHNAKGYAAMATAVHAYIKPLIARSISTRNTICDLVQNLK